MKLKLNVDGSITIAPQTKPESMNNIFIEYVMPKGLGHLEPTLVWGSDVVEGSNKYFKKNSLSFDMGVMLYENGKLFKSYELDPNTLPEMFIGYNMNTSKDLLKYIKELEIENRKLKERGDLI